MRRLIINADGLGFTPGVTAGIRETVKFGIVKSASAVPNFEAASEIGGFAQEFPQVSIGIHLNLSVGRPVTDPIRVRSLVNPETGEFWGNDLPIRLMTGRVRYDEMVTELGAQVRRLQDMGVVLTHIDGHQNKHLYPPFFSAALHVAQKVGIRCIRSHRRFLTGSLVKRIGYYSRHPQRVVTHLSGWILTGYAGRKGLYSADRLISPGYADTSRKFLLQSWMDLIHTLPTGTSEIYCHPAYPDDQLRQYASYVEPRRAEVEILTSEELKAAFQAAGVELISFYDLGN